MPLVELRKALLAAVDLIPTDESIAPEAKADSGDYTKENSEGTGQIIEGENAGGGQGENGTKDTELAQPNVQEVENPPADTEGEIPNATVITSDAMRYEELSQRISNHESQIKELAANIANALVEIGKIKSSLVSVTAEVDAGVIVPRTVRSLEDSIRGI